MVNFGYVWMRKIVLFFCACVWIGKFFFVRDSVDSLGIGEEVGGVCKKVLELVKK